MEKPIKTLALVVHPGGEPKPPGAEPHLTIQQIALMQAADWFDAYAEAHEKTPGKEGHAIRNRQRAMFCRLVAKPDENVAVVRHLATGKLHGVSLITGDIIWGPVE